MTRRILVVDDDPHIREVICFALEKTGMTTIIARDGAQALVHVAAQMPDLIVMDIGMPEMDGLEVCKRIRKSSDVPILFLSARDEEIDRILGLEIGGDDYVTKPFSPRELVARVNVILRRTMAQIGEAAGEGTLLTKGCLVINPQAREVSCNGAEVTLTALEFTLLKSMLARAGMVFTRDQLMALVYGPGIHVSDRTIDSHIRNIRAKIATAGCSNAIETVHGVGFRLGRCEASA